MDWFVKPRHASLAEHMYQALLLLCTSPSTVVLGVQRRKHERSQLQHRRPHKIVAPEEQPRRALVAARRQQPVSQVFWLPGCPPWTSAKSPLVTD